MYILRFIQPRYLLLHHDPPLIVSIATHLQLWTMLLALPVHLQYTLVEPFHYEHPTLLCLLSHPLHPILFPNLHPVTVQYEIIISYHSPGEYVSVVMSLTMPNRNSVTTITTSGDWNSWSVWTCVYGNSSS
jgi:hypothetical protein